MIYPILLNWHKALFLLQRWDGIDSERISATRFNRTLVYSYPRAWLAPLEPGAARLSSI